jgi:hypothetical protein
MALIHLASVEQLRRMLELFPASLLKTEWPGLKGHKKADVCELIAKTKDVERIRSFVVNNFAHCRQHVLLLNRAEGDPDILSAFPPTEEIGSMPGSITFYLSSVAYQVYLLGPMEMVQVDVLWPIRIEIRDKIVIVRSVVLERDPQNYSGRTSLKAIKEFDEKKVSLDLGNLGYTPLDINKGVKALWESKYMDAFRSSFRKKNSTSTEVMDGEIGIRDNAPEIYEVLASKPLLNTTFKPDAELENSIGVFQINPTLGRIGFTSYTENSGDSDAIIKAILDGNS